MNVMKIQKPIAFNELPIIDYHHPELIGMNANELKKFIQSKALPAWVDGLSALIYIGERSNCFSEEKIVVLYEEKNERWPEGFQTKYFFMREPGTLYWGHHDEKMHVEHRSL